MTHSLDSTVETHTDTYDTTHYFHSSVLPALYSPKLFTAVFGCRPLKKTRTCWWHIPSLPLALKLAGALIGRECNGSIITAWLYSLAPCDSNALIVSPTKLRQKPS